MPYATKDIGGGVQQLVYSADTGNAAPLEQARDTLGLVELGQRIELGSLDRKLKEDQIKNLPFAKMKADAELEAARIAVKKAKVEQLTNAYTSIIDISKINPKLGQQLGAQAGIQVEPNPDGTIGFMFPGSNGKTHALTTIDPLKETNTDKIFNNENVFRDEYIAQTKTYKVLVDQLKAGEVAATMGTGASDGTLLSAAARANNPGEAQNLNDLEIIRASNLPLELKNLFEKNQGTAAGWLQPEQREALLDVIRLRHKVGKDAAIALARNYGTMASNPRLGTKKENVLLGGPLDIKDIYPEDYPEKFVGPQPDGSPVSNEAATRLTNQPGRKQQKPAPIEAGFPRGRAPAPAPAPFPVRNKKSEPRFQISEDGLNELLGEGIREFQGGK